jgi:hypothetical protein
MRLIEPETRDQLDQILGPVEREMLDTLDDGGTVPADSATRVRAFRIRRALGLLSPQTVVICARGRGYTLRKLEA